MWLMAFNGSIICFNFLMQRTVDESGGPQGFDARAWLNCWLVGRLPRTRSKIAHGCSPLGALTCLRMLLPAQTGSFRMRRHPPIWRTSHDT